MDRLTCLGNTQSGSPKASQNLVHPSLSNQGDEDGFWSLQVLTAMKIPAQISSATLSSNTLDPSRPSSATQGAHPTQKHTGISSVDTVSFCCWPAHAQVVQDISFCLWPPKHLREPLRSYKKNVLCYRGARFASLTEAAFAGVLEHFVPSFTIAEGESYEVSLLGKSRVDFCVEGVLVEFHVPRLGDDEGNIGDFLTREEFRAFTAQMKRVGRNKHQRKKLLRDTRNRLFETYVQRRYALLQLSPRRDQELIIVRSREEFYERVLKRFARPEVPLFAEFLGMYWYLVDVVLRENQLPGLRSTSVGYEAEL